jgi:hypothetical protein
MQNCTIRLLHPHQLEVMDRGLCIHPAACESFSDILHCIFLPSKKNADISEEAMEIGMH